MFALLTQPSRKPQRGFGGCVNNLGAAMKPADLRRHCLAQPEAVEEFPFTDEHSVFKVAGKMFALSALKRRPLQISVKCDPDLAIEFRASYEAVAAGWH